MKDDKDEGEEVRRIKVKENINERRNKWET